MQAANLQNFPSFLFFLLGLAFVGICGRLFLRLAKRHQVLRTGARTRRSETLRQYMTNMRPREGKLNGLAAVFRVG